MQACTSLCLKIGMWLLMNFNRLSVESLFFEIFDYNRLRELLHYISECMEIFNDDGQIVLMVMEEIMATLLAKELRRLDADLPLFHRKVGHPTKRVMETILRRRRLYEVVFERLRLYRCPTYEELKTTEPVPPETHAVPECPWTIVGSNLAEWKHPDDARDERTRIFIAVDECPRICVAAVWCVHQAKTNRNITSKQLFALFLE